MPFVWKVLFVDAILKRQLAARQYVPPAELLKTVRDASGNYTEAFQAGFVADMVQQMGGTGARVRVSLGEVQDADAVLMLDRPTVSLAGETPAFKLLQLKEFSPRCSRPFQEFLDELKLKYPKSPDLMLAIHVNQDTPIELGKLDFTGFGVEQVHLFGSDGVNPTMHGGPVADWIRGVIWEGCLRDGRVFPKVRQIRPSRSSGVS